MKKIWMIVMMSAMLGACSEDSEQTFDVLQLSEVTRASDIIDAGEYQSPIQIFLMAGTSKTEGNFVYNTDSKTWTSTIGVKENDNYIYGFSPSDAAAGTISPIPSGAADYSGGAVMTLDNLNAVGGDDLCVVVGVKGGSTGEPTPGTPAFGAFEFKKQGTNNYVSLLLDHLYAAIEFKIKIGAKYNELRDIYLKKMELQSAKTASQAVVTLTANTAGTNPITDVRFTSSDKAQANTVYDYGTDASTTQGLKLATDGTPFVSYCAPIPGMGNHLKLICTYDVYNRKGTKVRENCVAENSLADLSGLTIERGKKSVINLTVEPTYLYQLSEDELDNPGIKISVSGN